MYENNSDVQARRTEWRDALRQAHREGAPQTTGVLCRIKERRDIPVGRCCLGVAADLAVSAGRMTTRLDRDVVIYSDVENRPWSDYSNESASELTTAAAQHLGFGYDTDPILLHTETLEGRTLYSRGHDPNAEDWDGTELSEPLSYSAATLNDGHKLTFDQIADCLTWTFGLEG